MKKKSRKKGIILIIVIALVALVGAGVMFVYGKFSQMNRVELDSDRVKVSEVYESEESLYSGQEVIALVGLDARDSSERANSDTMILAFINHNNKTIKLVSLYRDTFLNIGSGFYNKANAAYCIGGPEDFLSMVNLNLDLNVSKFLTTNFTALADCIDILGGLDIEMTRQELIHMNNYNVETSEVAGREYQAIELPDASEFDGVMTRSFHCTGTQAVSYARIRYTEGWDYKRTERQRIVLQKMKDKLKEANPAVYVSIMDTVLPQITTNMSATDIISLAKSLVTYEITDQAGFPFEKQGAMIEGKDAVVPITLESNVIQLHELVYPDIPYTPSYTVTEYSNTIAAKANGSYVDESIYQAEDYGVLDTPAPTPEATNTPEPTPAETPEVTPVLTEEPELTPEIEPEEPTPEPEVTPEPQPEEPTPEPENDQSNEPEQT